MCRRVASREPHLKKFAVRYEVIIFVAGRKSSNGRVLYEVCRSANPRTYLVEGPEELQKGWFEGMESVGICGATSTPQWLMERVKERIIVKIV
jgi:4-hydroxy-3-methylbut-2-enyl diphosphate reductase